MRSVKSCYQAMGGLDGNYPCLILMTTRLTSGNVKTYTSNSIVPKITIVTGNSFGAGNYALCGKAYDPNFILAWPNAKYAVMGADQASGTLFAVLSRSSPSVDAQKVRDELHKKYIVS